MRWGFDMHHERAAKILVSPPEAVAVAKFYELFAYVSFSEIFRFGVLVIQFLNSASSKIYVA